MYRTYMIDLEKWLNNPRRKPLLVSGARQVGKSYLIKDLFAEKYFKDKYIYIDCAVEDEFTKYCENNTNAESILNYLSLDKNMKIDENTLLIFDEVQECLPIITLLKYFCPKKEKYRLLLLTQWLELNRENNKRGVKEDKKFLFPVGKINQLPIYPMNFDEFIINKNKLLYEEICKSYIEKRPLEDALHEKAMDLFHSYMLIGGMSEVVDTYLDTNSYIDAISVLKNLCDNYLSELFDANEKSAYIFTPRNYERYNQMNACKTFII